MKILLDKYCDAPQEQYVLIESDDIQIMKRVADILEQCGIKNRVDIWGKAGIIQHELRELGCNF
jgi:hypothetical protein